MDSKSEKQAAGRQQPWWRVRVMWLVLGGPLLVVVAAIVTAIIAARGADEVIGSGAAPQSRQPADEAPGSGDLRPAIEARNKAAAEAAAAAASAGQR